MQKYWKWVFCYSFLSLLIEFVDFALPKSIFLNTNYSLQSLANKSLRANKAGKQPHTPENECWKRSKRPGKRLLNPLYITAKIFWWEAYHFFLSHSVAKSLVQSVGKKNKNTLYVPNIIYLYHTYSLLIIIYFYHTYPLSFI